MGNQSKRNGNGFFTIIKKNHGEHVVSYMKNFSRDKIQLTIKFNQRILLLHCRKEKILSKHLQFESSHLVYFDYSNIIHMHTLALYKFKSTLYLEIRDICITIYRLSNYFRYFDKIIRHDLFIIARGITR